MASAGSAELGAAGEKRKTLEPSNVQSVDDVAAWMEQIIASNGCGAVKPDVTEKILSNIRENEVDREVLATLTEDDIRDTLGVAVLGQRSDQPRTREPRVQTSPWRMRACMPLQTFIF